MNKERGKWCTNLTKQDSSESRATDEMILENDLQCLISKMTRDCLLRRFIAQQFLIQICTVQNSPALSLGSGGSNMVYTSPAVWERGMLLLPPLVPQTKRIAGAAIQGFRSLSLAPYPVVLGPVAMQGYGELGGF